MNKGRLLKILLVVSLLTGCTTSTGLTPETLVLTQPTLSQTTAFVTEIVTETREEGKMPEMVYADYEEGMGGIKWIASYVEGKLATVTEEYVITYDQNGNVISKTPVIGSREETEAEAPKMQFGGTVSVGSEFYPTMYTYGVDCVGCHVTANGVGGTSAGISLSKTSVKQPDGTWQKGVKYGDCHWYDNTAYSGTYILSVWYECYVGWS